jgi:predicted permease
MLDEPHTFWVFAFGRPRPGVSLAQARTEAAALSAQLDAERPAEGFSRRATVAPIWESPQGAQTYMLPAVSLMGAMSGLLLLVVCANVAGLVLVRSLSRRGEIAARLALGASRTRILRLLLAENLVLAIPGALVGFWLSRVAEPYLAAAQPSTVALPLYFNVGAGSIALVALLLACASALASGLIPAVKASRVDLASAIKDDLSPRGSSKSHMRSALAVSQVAMAVVLLVGTALVTRSLDEARRADPGFEARSVASVTLDLLPAGYDAADGRVFYQTLLDALRADPAIEAASLTKDPLLMLMDFNTREFLIEGYSRRRNEDLQFLFNVIGTEHFRTLRIPLVAGRDFEDRDDGSAPGVAIVNETLARRFWGEPAAAIGRRVQTPAWPGGALEWRTVIGVARDIKYARLTEAPRPYVYLPHAQAFNWQMSVHARGAGDPARLIETVRWHVRDLDPSLPILEAATLADQTSLGVGVYDVTARTLGIVGLAAIALMALGIYGLVAYTVRQSTHEIGIRMAVGAPRAWIVRRFVMRGLRLGIAGAALGTVAALALTRLMSSLLYGVTATDLVSFSVAALAVLSVALAASFVPAWRAAHVDPLASLRHQ